MPPDLVRSAAAWISSICRPGSAVARQRRSGRRARTPRPEHGASTSARSNSDSFSSRTSVLTTRTFLTPRRWTFCSSSRARPRCSSTAVTCPRSIVAFAPGAAQASRILSPSREPTASAASCEPRLCQTRVSSSPSILPALEPVGARNVGRLADRHRRADDELGRFVLCSHQCERLVLAEVPDPRLVDPVGVRLRERPRRQSGDERGKPFDEAPRDGIREAGRVRQARAADELDRVVDGRVGRRVAPRGLVAGDPKRREDRRVELRGGTASEDVDAVVDRPHPLHRSVGDPLSERAVARVEPVGGRGHRPVGVGAVLEDAAHDPEGGSSRGAVTRARRAGTPRSSFAAAPPVALRAGPVSRFRARRARS